MDLGATWGWAHHPYLSDLLTELGIRPVAQYSAGATAYETALCVHRLPNHPSGSAGYSALLPAGPPRSAGRWPTACHRSAWCRTPA